MGKNRFGPAGGPASCVWPQLIPFPRPGWQPADPLFWSKRKIFYIVSCGRWLKVLNRLLLLGGLVFIGAHGLCQENLPALPLPPITPSLQTLLIECLETVALSPEGQAQVTRILRVPPSPLSELYQAYWEAYSRDESVRKNFQEAIQKQFQIFLGSAGTELRVTPPATALLAAQPMEVTVVLTFLALARYVPDQRFWEITLGPQTRELQNSAVHEFLNAFLLPSLYLASLPGEQVLVRRREARFLLPKGAQVLNVEELGRTSWSVDFGGGTSLRGHVRVEQNLVLFTEELILMEKAPVLLVDERTLPAIYRALASYGVFKIRYSLAGGPVHSALPSPSAELGLPQNFSGDWGYSYSRTISANLGLPSGGSLSVSATPSLYFGAHLGWEFKPWWEGGGLRKFEAWIDLNPSLTASLNASVSGTLRWEKSVDVWSYGVDFWFWVDYVPVWIRLSIEASIAASVNAAARVNFTASASAGGTNRLGARWEGGWTKIATRSPWASRPSFSVTTGAATTLAAGPELALAAYVYNVAGPFVAFTIYDKAEIKISPKTRSLGIGFKASGGVKLAGWLQNLLGGLGSYSVDFYTWETTLASGSW